MSTDVQDDLRGDEDQAGADRISDAKTKQAKSDADMAAYTGAGSDQAEAFANDPKNASSNSASAQSSQSPRGNQSGGRLGQLGNLAKTGLSYVSGNKKKIGAGGGIIGLIVAMLFGFSSLLPLKLLHIEQNLFKHNFGVEQSVEHKLATRLLRSTLSPYDKNGGYKITGRGFFGNKWGKFRLDGFEKQLEAKGVRLNIDPNTHELLSVERGGVVESMKGINVADRLAIISDIVNEHVPPWQVGKRVKMIRLMTIRYGVSFRAWRAEKFKDTTEFLKDRVKRIRTGASADEIASAKAARDAANKDPNNTNAIDNAKTTAPADSAIARVQAVFEETGSMKAAIKAGAAEIKGNKALGFTGIVILVCAIQELANNAIANGYDVRTEQLMRMGSEVLSSAAQNRKGDHNYADTLNQTMLLYEGDKTVKPIQVGTATVTPEAAMDFTQAADWKRATGEPVTEANPEMSGAANPDAKTGLGDVMGILNQITGAAGGVGNKVCSVALSWFGTFVGVVEFAANLIDGGALEAVGTVAKLALQVTLMVKVVPIVLAAGAGLAITGTETLYSRWP